MLKWKWTSRISMQHVGVPFWYLCPTFVGSAFVFFFIPLSVS